MSCDVPVFGVGWLYSKVDAYLKPLQQQDSTKGLVVQAFAFALQVCNQCTPVYCWQPSVYCTDVPCLCVCAGGAT